jgi:hypothetical protein
MAGCVAVRWVVQNAGLARAMPNWDATAENTMAQGQGAARVAAVANTMVFRSWVERAAEAAPWRSGQVAIRSMTTVWTQMEL